MSKARRFLIAEDEAMIAMLLEDYIDLLGHATAATVSSLADGLAAVDAGGFDAAILDVNLGRDKCWPLADALRASDVPYVFATGGGDVFPPEHVAAPTLMKPYSLASLEAVLTRI